MATLALNLWLALAGPGGRRAGGPGRGFLLLHHRGGPACGKLGMYAASGCPTPTMPKWIDAWPESGFRYLLSFVLEYAPGFRPCSWPGPVRAAPADFWPGSWRGSRASGVLRAPETLRAVTRTAVATLEPTRCITSVGGDHFEYRVFSHLAPLVAGLAQRRTA
ncbi:MAG: hypothetical protein U1F77_03030 [Kiritimatiellia bacterium]